MTVSLFFLMWLLYRYFTRKLCSVFFCFRLKAELKLNTKMIKEIILKNEKKRMKINYYYFVEKIMGIQPV